MVTNSGSWIPQYGTRAPLEVVSMALLPAQNKGQFSTCAAGAFDDYFRQVGANLQRSLALSVVVRLGWEANIGSGVHPWGVNTADQVPAYVQCWRHAALALKTGGPRLNLEWTNAKKTQNKALSVLAMYPGNDVVDLIGVHYYDTGPLKNTQTIWDKYYSATINNPAPRGGVFREETVSHSRVASERDVGLADASKVRRKRRGMRPEEIQRWALGSWYLAKIFARPR